MGTDYVPKGSDFNFAYDIDKYIKSGRAGKMWKLGEEYASKKMKRSKEVYFFANGTTMVFDNKGEQIPECQGCILDVNIINKLNKYCDKDTVFYFGDWKDKTKSAINLRWWFGEHIKKEANK